MNETPSVRIAIDACMLSNHMHYDGDRKPTPSAADELSRYSAFVKICAVSAIDMGVPRSTIRPVGHPKKPHLIGSKDNNLDATNKMTSFTCDTVASLNYISGYIRCLKPPTCEIGSVPVYFGSGKRVGKTGVGVFSKQLMVAQTLLRVGAYSCWQATMTKKLIVRRLQDFHPVTNFYCWLTNSLYAVQPAQKTHHYLDA